MIKPRRLERLNAALFYLLLALLIWLVYLIVQPFLQPLAWAAVLAILITPWHRRLAARWGNSEAALAATAAITVGLIVPVTFLSIYFVREGVQAAEQIQGLAASGRLDWAARLWSSLASVMGMGNVSFSALLQDVAKSVAALLAGSLASLVANVLRVVLDAFLLLFAFFFFLRDGRAIMFFIRRLLPFEEALREKILAEAQKLIHASITVSAIIALVQGAICGIAFALAGISEPLFWGVLMSFFSLLPVVGAWIIWLPVAVWMLLTRQFGGALLLFGLCGGIAGTADNILRPLLMSGTGRLNSLMIFISVLGGIAAFGMIGLVLGPIIFAVALVILDVYARAQDHDVM